MTAEQVELVLGWHHNQLWRMSSVLVRREKLLIMTCWRLRLTDIGEPEGLTSSEWGETGRDCRRTCRD